MSSQEIKQEYYTEIDIACRTLYELELDISPTDVSVGSFTEEGRIFNKASQRAFWWKFMPDDKALHEYTGREFALKFMCENGNSSCYENWVKYPESMQIAFQGKLQELTGYKGWTKKRINPVCQSRCDKCKKHISELVKCQRCKYGRYCTLDCMLADKQRHLPICLFIVRYLGWDKTHA
ncbi:hypothetical protein K457DRAFT_143591 [Linnemannia elongata AG-77]|uniref:MYND-type domain-containing protein n=1 Tax=Linnemannia elongata AG-77 TaxID=1314771 RepID=A0A197JAF9_9FUNG|nr:hypothetical protein K457DRAFT_143591 [Linnemannia elongata AG-77]